MWPYFQFPFTVYFILNKPVFSDHLSYVTTCLMWPYFNVSLDRFNYMSFGFNIIFYHVSFLASSFWITDRVIVWKLLLIILVPCLSPVGLFLNECEMVLFTLVNKQYNTQISLLARFNRLWKIRSDYLI
jgi:hypothetical protein